MRSFRAISLIQIGLVVAIYLLPPTSVAAILLACCSCLLLLISWNSCLKAKATYAGWLGSFVSASTFLALPAVVALMLWQPTLHAPLFAVFAASITAEKIRTNAEHDSSLPWWILPVIGSSMIVYRYTADLLAAFHFTVAVFAIAAYVSFYAHLRAASVPAEEIPGTPTLVPQKVRRPARRAAGKAA